MRRLISGFAVASSMLSFLPAPYGSAASNTAVTDFPLDGPNQLETHTILDCYKADGHCDFTAGGADMRPPAGVPGFPPSLWARQSTEIRSTNRLAYLDAHATSQFERVMKEGGSDGITTVYFA